MSGPALLPRFTLEDADRAYDAWGSNCGPAALACIAGLTLDEVRVHMGDFETRGYTNPSLMLASLQRAGCRVSRTLETSPSGPPAWPRFGLVRVQWEGPWTLPNVPIRARYRHTHWVGGATKGDGGRGVFDVNCLNNGTGWSALADWERVIVPALTRSIKRASGGWHVTHAWEISRLVEHRRSA